MRPLTPEHAALAQPVEHIIRNDGVRCSSHLSGTNLFNNLDGISLPNERILGPAGIREASGDGDPRRFGQESNSPILMIGIRGIKGSLRPSF